MPPSSTYPAAPLRFGRRRRKKRICRLYERGTGEKDNADFCVFAGISKGLAEFLHSFGTESVPFVRSIDGNFGGAATFVIENVFVGFGGLPFNLHNQSILDLRPSWVYQGSD